MESDHRGHSPNPTTVGDASAPTSDHTDPRPSGSVPSLPPRVDDGDQDPWNGVEAEPDLLHHHVPVTAPHRGLMMAPTRLARVLASTGWAGELLAMLLLLVALVPAFDTGDSRDFMIPLDESAWFGGTLIVSTLVTYFGWFWWSTAASYNAHRVVPLATSPWLPTLVYLGGPVFALAGLDLGRAARPYVVFAGLVWLGLGHLMVVASLRTSADRMGASTYEFSKLLWLPLAWMSYRLVLVSLVSHLDGHTYSGALFFACSAIGFVFPVLLVNATWRSAVSFDTAYRRINKRYVVAEVAVVVPTSGAVAAALRERSASA